MCTFKEFSEIMTNLIDIQERNLYDLHKQGFLDNKQYQNMAQLLQQENSRIQQSDNPYQKVIRSQEKLKLFAELYVM